MVNPKIISWPCQTVGGMPVDGRVVLP
jgi:hypothetical protein